MGTGIDKLKTCAEAVGIKYAEIFGKAIGYYNNGVPTIYDPEHNDAQMAELLKWLLDNGWTLRKCCQTYWLDHPTIKNITAPILNQAVIEAVCEVKK